VPGDARLVDVQRLDRCRSRQLAAARASTMRAARIGQGLEEVHNMGVHMHISAYERRQPSPPLFCGSLGRMRGAGGESGCGAGRGGAARVPRRQPGRRPTRLLHPPRQAAARWCPASASPRIPVPGSSSPTPLAHRGAGGAPRERAAGNDQGVHVRQSPGAASDGSLRRRRWWSGRERARRFRAAARRRGRSLWPTAHRLVISTTARAWPSLRSSTPNAGPGERQALLITRGGLRPGALRGALLTTLRDGQGSRCGAGRSRALAEGRAASARRWRSSPTGSRRRRRAAGGGHLARTARAGLDFDVAMILRRCCGAWCSRRWRRHRERTR